MSDNMSSTLRSTAVMEHGVKVSVRYLGEKPLLPQLGKAIFWVKTGQSGASSTFMFPVDL